MGNSGRFPPLKKAKTSSIPVISPVLEAALKKTEEVVQYHDRRIPKRLDRLENVVLHMAWYSVSRGLSILSQSRLRFWPLL